MAPDCWRWQVPPANAVNAAGTRLLRQWRPGPLLGAPSPGPQVEAPWTRGGACIGAPVLGVVAATCRREWRARKASALRTVLRAAKKTPGSPAPRQDAAPRFPAPLEETLLGAYKAAVHDLASARSEPPWTGGTRWHMEVEEDVLCEGSAFYTRLRIDPLPATQAQAVGNVLRRTLLREDFFRTHAAVAFRVQHRAFTARGKGARLSLGHLEQATHEFSSVPGVHESMIDVVRNVQRLSIAPVPELRPPMGTLAGIAAASADGPETWHWTTQRCGPCAVQARDLDIVDSASHYEEPLRLSEPGQHLCRLTVPTMLRLEVQAVCCSQTEWEESPVFLKHQNCLRFSGWLVVPPLFSPVLKVNYTVTASDSENAQKGSEAVHLELWTRPTCRPTELVRTAAASLLAALEARRGGGNAEARGAAVPSSHRAGKASVGDASLGPPATGEAAAWQELLASAPETRRPRAGPPQEEAR